MRKRLAHFLLRKVRRLKKTDEGLSVLLKSAGLSAPDVRRYLELSTRSGTDTARAQILRGQRGRLMEELHQRQQILDQVDYLIWQVEKKHETKKGR